MFGFGGAKRDPNKPLVLHIDDEKDLRLMIEAALKPLALEIISAADGPSGIALAEKEKPQLILLDIRMPGMDGFDACRIMKEKPALKAVPILMMTALSQMKDVERAVAQGADGYILKPVEMPKLRQKVAEILKLPNWQPPSKP